MTKEFYKAKRGDIAVIVKTTRVYTMHTGSYVSQSITVCTVTNITRDGLAKCLKTADGQVRTLRDWDTIQIVSRDLLQDVEALLSHCANRQTPAYGTYDPFKDMADVKATIKRYVKHDRLND